ncbi:MAG: glycerophosphoryl diester phosphodiesterase [Proteobacteria bacterium]|nr:glycerophosphoryl diester phosphodiesterase [Pseudomonadota bacterium]
MQTKSTFIPKIIGHRGAAGHAPENTLASMHKAADLGVEWVEFDTKITKDGAVIVFHDDKLERITGVKGDVAKTALKEIQTFDAGAWFGEEFTGERVATLEQAIQVLADHGLGANIEIKPSPRLARKTGRAVVDVLIRAWPETLPKPLVSSFNVQTLETVRDEAPDLARALLVFKIPRNWQALLNNLGCVALHVQAKHLTAKKVGVVKDAGYALRAYTVNESAEAEKLFGWGVDAVISDYPDRIMVL